MSNRTKSILVLTALAGGVALLLFVGRPPGSAPSNTIVVGESASETEPFAESVPQSVRVVDYVPPTNAAAISTRTFRVLPDQLLATVNGERIQLGDLVPVESGSVDKAQELSAEAYTYLLERAVNRLMITQEAKKRGIALKESQLQQLSKLRGQRLDGGPGMVRQMNLNTAAVEFELRDAEAFMLQTELMATTGASANVTSGQVLDFFTTRRSEFAELPEEEGARQDAWAEIETTIRHRLASAVRSNYNTSLSEYLADLKSASEVQVFALAE